MVPAQFIEKIISPVNGLGTLVQNHLTINFSSVSFLTSSLPNLFHLNKKVIFLKDIS